ncbi:glycosyl transferase [Helicobacter cinaedi]|uniref:glycosyltransferase family 4 protein n=1 Tax=Helicobacter cinaedi TaxID=213 RepID=UPI001F2AF012|nr:glycosyltransferase family 4 protein [Helicobacter cinaedi]BDB67189.1 glycosyl transferase [Helicobacter cinaedi]
MKLFIILKDITESGGGERVCVNLSNAFSEIGFEVHIISFFRLEKDIVFSLNENINVRFLSHTTPKSKNPLKKLFNKSIYRYILSKKVDTIAQQEKPDIVLANDGWYIPKAKLDSIQYIRLWHLNAPKKIDKRKQKIFNLFDTLVVLSSRELDKWQSYHKNVKVIPNFLPNISQKNTDSNQHRIISVGRLSAEKGFLRLIDIWEKVQERIKGELESWQLVIVGDGVMKEQIQAKILEKNLQDTITLKPFTKDIESEYLNASIYAMTSHFEGFGMVLVEASSYALPCIAFDIAAGPSDIIESHTSGYLIEDNDLQDYADKLIDLMSDKQKRESMGLQAKQRVKEKFSKEAIMPLWEEVFRA